MILEELLALFKHQHINGPLMVSDRNGNVLDINNNMKCFLGCQDTISCLSSLTIDGISFPIKQTSGTLVFKIHVPTNAKQSSSDHHTSVITKSEKIYNDESAQTNKRRKVSASDLFGCNDSNNTLKKRLSATFIGDDYIVWQNLTNDTESVENGKAEFGDCQYIDTDGNKNSNSSELLEFLLNNNDGVVVVFNKEGAIQGYNDGYKHLFPNYKEAHTLDHLIGWHDSFIRNSYMLKKHFAAACLYLKHDGSVSLPCEKKHIDKSLSYSFRPVVIGNEIIYVVLHARVIKRSSLFTKWLKSFHEDNQISESKQEAKEDSGAIWLWYCNENLILKDVSHSFFALTGFEKNNIIGRSVDDPNSIGSVCDSMALSGMMHVIEQRQTFLNRDISIITPNGEKWLRISGHPTYDPLSGDFKGYNGTGSDITSWKETSYNMKLMESRNEMLLSIIELMPLGLIIHDAKRSEYPIIFANEHFTKISGYERNEIMGQGIEFPFSEDSENNTLNLREKIIAGEEFWFEANCFTKNGGDFLSRIRVFPILDEKGDISAFVRVQSDITDSYNRTQREMESQRLSTMGELARGMAHDINNLLQPIVSLPDFIKDVIPSTNKEAHEDIKTISLSARKIRETVRNVMRFSEKREETLYTYDLRKELETAIKFNNRLLPDSISINYKKPNYPVFAMTNRSAFAQVITNLCINASQAMGGCGVINITLQRTKLNTVPPGLIPQSISVKSGVYAVIEITDTGIGIDNHQIPELLTPFYTTKSSGTGLGLPVVHQNIEKWGGFLSLHSVRHEGTSFFLHIPIVVDVSEKYPDRRPAG